MRTFAQKPKAAQQTPSARLAIPLRAHLGFQPKLTVSTPGDVYEQEADHVAEQVMRMPEPRAQRQEELEEEVEWVPREPATHSGPDIRRQVEEEVEEEVQEEVEEEEEEESLQAKEVDDHAPEAGPDTEAQLRALRGGGRPLPEPVRAFFEPRFGFDFSQVRIHTSQQAASSAREVNARAYTVGHDIVWGAGEYAPETNRGNLLLAHELTHVVQQSSPAPTSPPSVMRQKGKLAAKIVGWVVKVGERKLIKTVTIYSEKELTILLNQGYNILVKRGSSTAKRIAKKVWGDDILHHTGHIIKKTGKKGLSHFQPAKHLIGRAGEKGWHIFYSALPILFFADDVEAMEVYEDMYPGKSIANYLTVTKYVGEDSWLSYLDWINPGELIAVGGDIGRDLDRERTKELRALVFNRVAADGTVQTYELSPEGDLVRVLLVRPDGEKKILSADEYYTFLGKKSEEPLPASAAQDGTKHPLYASTFDAEHRIYISKQGWDWDSKTLSFYLPAEDAKKLQKIGEFYVMENLSIDHVYAYVHPRHREALKQPGFKVPMDMLDVYKSSPKEAFLQKMLTAALQSAKVRGADLWQAK